MGHDLRKIKIIRTNEDQPIATYRHFQGQSVKCEQYQYVIKDENSKRLNEWDFEINVPNDLKEGISIQPIQVSKKKLFAGLKRKALMFYPSSKSKKSVYCSCYISKNEGSKIKRQLLKKREITSMPNWFKRYFNKYYKLKGDVINTSPGLNDHPVFSVSNIDHFMMIKIYFILRVWTLEIDFE